MRYITNFEREDGFGGQYMSIIYSIIYAELVNAEFVYTPFKLMEHNYDNDPCFLNKKEEFINIKNNYKNINDVNGCISTSLGIYPIIESDMDNRINLNSFKRVKELFFLNKRIKNNSNILNVAVHIRRKNPHDNLEDYGYTNDEYFLNCINHIRKEYPENKKIHIYSQGALNSFEKFKSNDVVFHLNEPIEDTFYDLVTADILVMSKGSFSYSAALLSNGIIYYIPFWHPKLSHWKIL
jgi:hypothetical protein